MVTNIMNKFFFFNTEYHEFIIVLKYHPILVSLQTQQTACFYFRGINFCVLFKRSILWVLIFVGIIFAVKNHMHMVLLIQPLRAITSFITSIGRYGRLVMERKRKIFNPFAISVMKDKELVHTYFISTIITW